MLALPEWVLIVAVCVGHISCFHHSPSGGWSSKEACLLPAETIIAKAEENLNNNPQFAEEEHYFKWDCVTHEDLSKGDFRLTNRKVLGGRWV